jgi:hypothetical protein
LRPPLLVPPEELELLLEELELLLDELELFELLEELELLLFEDELELLLVELEDELPVPSQEPKFVHDESLPGTVLVYQLA